MSLECGSVRGRQREENVPKSAKNRAHISPRSINWAILLMDITVTVPLGTEQDMPVDEGLEPHFGQKQQAFIEEYVLSCRYYDYSAICQRIS